MLIHVRDTGLHHITTCGGDDYVLADMSDCFHHYSAAVQEKVKDIGFPQLRWYIS